MSNKYEDNEAAAIVMSVAVVAAAEKLGINTHEDFTDDQYQDALDLLVEKDIILSSYDVDECSHIYEFTDAVGHDLEQKILSGELTTLEQLQKKFQEILDA